MNRREINRRDFLKAAGTLAGATMVMGPTFAFSQATPGSKVNPMKITTTTAGLDPVRPEVARACAQAFGSIGWDVEAEPTDYNQNVQKVVLEHDYDMWFVMLSGSSLRIDPNVFIFQCHHSSQYTKGGYNWEGLSDRSIDELAEAQQAAMDLEKRKELVYKAQEFIHEAQSMNVVAYPQMTNAYRSDRIRNLTPMMGEGIGSFWSDISIEPINGDGYVRTGFNNPIKTLNPVNAKSEDEFMMLRMIYDHLFRIGPDGVPRPWAAEKYAVIDPTTVEITLREGLLWHDGRPLTVEDIKFTFEYHGKWKAPFYAKALATVKSIDITGKRTIRFQLEKPYAPFLPTLLGAIFLIPKHIWQDIPEKIKDLNDPLNYPNDTPVGSGPFKFDHWDQGRELKVSAFKQHFHPPKCAGIIEIIYGSHDAMAAAIEKGECDRTRYVLKPSLLEDLKKVKNVVAKGYPNHGFYTLSYHTRRPPLSDPVFRKALAHVIPKDLIIQAVLSDYADKGGSVIGPANTFWHNPAVKPFPTDINRAKKILADAGYTWDNKGKLHYPKG
jgi:peptide/nickel transport system substrate-binding protein